MTSAAPSALRPHREAALIPPMREDEWQDFLADVRERGILQPLDVDGSTVLDGRHRLRAAKELKLATVPVRQVKLNGCDAATWMIKAAVLRRHLSDDQRAVMAARWKATNAKPTGAAAHGKSPQRSGELKGKTGPAAIEATAIFNVPRRKVDEATQIEHAAPALAEAVHRGEMKLKEAVRQVTRATQKREIEAYVPPVGEYTVIVADPPWRYEYLEGRVAPRDIPYPTMTTEEICAIKIPAAKDCVLWLWTTNAHMRDAYRVLDAWGFADKTILTWAKPRIGLGEWLRNQTEHCILAVRGKPMVDGRSTGTLLSAPSPGVHSQKPDEFFALVESICPSKSRLELFARRERKGWVTSGSEDLDVTGAA